MGSRNKTSQGLAGLASAFGSVNSDLSGSLSENCDEQIGQELTSPSPFTVR